MNNKASIQAGVPDDEHIIQNPVANTETIPCVAAYLHSDKESSFSLVTDDNGWVKADNESRVKMITMAAYSTTTNVMTAPTNPNVQLTALVQAYLAVPTLFPKPH